MAANLPRRLASRAGVGITATLVFALALFSPVETVDSDPALALLAAQALVDHGSLRLDPYVDQEGLAYDLATDYRVRSYWAVGVAYPNSLGVPIVSVPAVWVANRFGWHMLDQETEFKTQNLLSALVCAAVFLLLFSICRIYLGVGRSLALALVCTLGTSVMSTGATGLWNTNVSLLFTGLAVLHLARRHTLGEDVTLAYVAVLLTMAFLVRPSTALLTVACLVYLQTASSRRTVIAARIALGSAALLVVASAVLPVDTLWPWMAGHYAPARLRQLNTPLGLGLYGVLLSPSRGLLVFSPFLALIGVGTVWYGRSLWRDPIARLCATWILLMTLMAAVVAGRWWGGHSFGPRMLSDLVPAFAVLACLVWREVTWERGRGLRTPELMFWVLAGVAVVIHSGQGLFNPATLQWNRMPNIDDAPSLALDWRFPQFLATTALLNARLDAFEEDRRGGVALPVRSMSTPIAFDADDAWFGGWYHIEEQWRWSRGGYATIELRLDDDEAGDAALYLLELVAGARRRQQVRVEVNGTLVGELELDGFEPVRRLVVVPATVLRQRADTVIGFVISDPGREPSDDRQLGLALRELRWRRLPADGETVSYTDDIFFTAGFSVAEAGWRWTDGRQARIDYPVGPAPRPEESAVAGDYVLELLAGANGRQRIELAVNGVAIGETVITGFEATRVVLPVPGAVVEANRMNTITLAIPNAATVPNDSRELGLALRSLALRQDREE